MAWLYTLLAALLAVGAAPLFLDDAVLVPRWDDAFFLRAAVCVAGSFWQADVPSLLACVGDVFKSPLMMLMALPWGPVGGTALGPGLALVSLALLGFFLLAFCLHGALRLGVGLIGIGLWLLALILNPVLTQIGGQFLVDMVFSLCVAAIFVLWAEALQSQPATLADARARGARWALVVAIGMLAKVPFGLFALLLPAMLWRGWRHQTSRPLFWTQLRSLLLWLAPVILLWLWQGWAYLRNALSAAFGAVGAAHGGPNETMGEYMVWMLGQIGAAGWLWLALILWAGWRLWRDARIDVWRFGPLGLCLMYWLIAANIANQDIRFVMPVMVGLPLALLLLPRPETPPRLSPWPAWFGYGLVAMALAVPLAQRVDLGPLAAARAVLAQLHEAGLRQLLVTTDAPHLNIETFLLARQIGPAEWRAIDIQSSVYDAIRGRDVAASQERLRASAAVFCQRPVPHEPAFTNDRSAALCDWMRGEGGVPLADDPQVLRWPAGRP